MPQPRTQAFIKTLKQLKIKFPEYATLLQSLIDQIEKGKEARIKAMLEQMRKDPW